MTTNEFPPPLLDRLEIGAAEHYMSKANKAQSTNSLSTNSSSTSRSDRI